jgi:hypothetical protein
VLHERAEQAPVDLADHERAIHRKTSHKVLLDSLYNDYLQESPTIDMRCKGLVMTHSGLNPGGRSSDGDQAE